MTGHVYVRVRAVDDVRAQTKEIVDIPRYEFFVSRNGSGGQDDGVSGPNGDLTMIAIRHATESGGGLALRPGRHDRDLVRCQIHNLFPGLDGFTRVVQVAKIERHVDVLDHAPSDHGDFSFVLGRFIDDLLNARNEAGERGDDDTTRG